MKIGILLLKVVILVFMAVLFLNETEQTVGILSWKFGYFSQVFRLSYVVKLINLVLTPVAFGS